MNSFQYRLNIVICMVIVMQLALNLIAQHEIRALQKAIRAPVEPKQESVSGVYFIDLFDAGEVVALNYRSPGIECVANKDRSPGEYHIACYVKRS
jgi:hypothetical protein